MNTIARVKMWGTTVGAVAWNDQRGLGSFEFEEAFLKKGLAISPLKLPIDEALQNHKIYTFPDLNRETFHGLPGLLADSLPDKFGNALIDTWLARQGRGSGSFNPVERLCYTGKRGMGALEFEPVIAPFSDKSAPLEIQELVSLIKDVFSQRAAMHTNIHEQPDKGMLEIIRVGTSAGGARAKAIIAYNEKTGEVRSGQIDGPEEFQYWIIKFDGVTNKQLGDPAGYGRIEYAYHMMAKACNIKLPDCRLMEENGRAHFLTKRFDRDGKNKIHMQSLCALAHFDYNASGIYSYEQAFQVIRQLGLPYTDGEELYRRMVFNVVARNQDDHTKNISFLMTKDGEWSLSPAYDVTYAYDPENKWMHSHQMSINGKRDHIEREDLLQTAKNMNIKKPGRIIEEVVEGVSNWKKFGNEAGVKDAQIKKIGAALLIGI